MEFSIGGPGVRIDTGRRVCWGGGVDGRPGQDRAGQGRQVVCVCVCECVGGGFGWCAPCSVVLVGWTSQAGNGTGGDK